MTIINQPPFETISNDDDGILAIFHRISYMYYSMIGTLLTIFFGLIISYMAELSDRRKATAEPEHEGGFRTPGHFSVGSLLSLQTQRRLSSFIHNVSQSTLKVEHKLKEVISHSNLHHLPHLHVPMSDDEERISILNEEHDQSNENGMSRCTGRRKMFFIGHHDDREHEE